MNSGKSSAVCSNALTASVFVSHRRQHARSLALALDGYKLLEPYTFRASCALPDNMTDSRHIAFGLISILAAAVGQFAKLNAQEPTVATRRMIAEAVVIYRREFMDDSSSYDICSLARAVGTRPESLGLNPALSKLMYPASSCSYAGKFRVSSAPIGIDSIGVGKETATVRVEVYHGEYSHQERFTLRRSGASWVVTGACLSAGSYAVLRDPRDSLRFHQRLMEADTSLRHGTKRP